MSVVSIVNGVVSLNGETPTTANLSPEYLTEVLTENRVKIINSIIRITESGIAQGDQVDVNKIGIWVVRLGLTRNDVIPEESFIADIKKQEDSGVFYCINEISQKYHEYWQAVASAGFLAHARKEITGPSATSYTWLLAGVLPGQL